MTQDEDARGAGPADDQVVEWTVAAGDAELAADRMWAAGATAVAVVERHGEVTLTASYPTPEAAATVAAELDGAVLILVDSSWRDEWKRYAEPVSIGDRLVVAPAWRDVELGGAGRDRLVLRIDPGPTFGSGSHASTRMVLAELDRRPPTGLTVLDVGCGSGILSVAAAALGADRVVAVDVDPEALRCTRTNAVANDVADRVHVAGSDLEAAIEPGRADLALINVTAGVHAEVGRAAVDAVRSGGTLLLAGLLPGQWRHVERSYPGAVVAEVMHLDGWEGLRLHRSGSSASTSRRPGAH